jgi:hypothetical protein
MDSDADRERMNRPGCAHCHTAQGYLRVTLGGEESMAPYDNVEGVICRACHLPAADGARIGGLRVGSPQDACQGCHDELVINEPDELSWSSQGGVYRGDGGAHIPGVEYPVSIHTGLAKGCVSCHMVPSTDGTTATDVGGHTFRVMTKGYDPEIFNAASCEACPHGITGDGLSISQRDVERMLETLASLLPQRRDPNQPRLREPRYPADPSLNEVQRRASWNYWLVQKDGSLGVHNPRYVRALLRNSILELQTAGGG